MAVGPAPESGAAPEGQALLERLEHWCNVQPNKVRHCLSKLTGSIDRRLNDRSITRIFNTAFLSLMNQSQRLFTFLDDHGREVDSLTYKVSQSYIQACF